MTKEKHNKPITTLIKNYLDKKSGKVKESRDEIQRRFFGLDWRHQKRIMLAFLNSGATDRAWAYSTLRTFWSHEFEEKVIELWEKYHEERCGWVVIRHCSKKYIMDHLEKLSADDRNYYFICRRMGEDKGFDIDKSRLSRKDYVVAMSIAGRIISDEEATDILYQEVHDWCCSEYPSNEIRNNAITGRGDICSAYDIYNISCILYYLHEPHANDAGDDFLMWNEQAKEEIRKSEEYAELKKKACSDYEFKQRLSEIAQKYLYQAIPQKYKSATDVEFDEGLKKEIQQNG